MYQFPGVKKILWDHTPLSDPHLLHLACLRPPILRLSEKVLRLVIRHLGNIADSTFSCLLIGSVVLDEDGQGVSLVVDQFDRGQCSEGGDNGLSATSPGDVLVPFQALKSTKKIPVTNKDQHLSAFKFLQHRCCSKDAVELGSFLLARGSCSHTLVHDVICCEVEFEVVSPSTHFLLTQINPVPIVPTALSKNLVGPTSLHHLQGTPKTGYLTMDHTRKLLLVLESDPKVYGLPLVGIWISGVPFMYSPFVWASCQRFISNKEIQDRVCSPPEPFLLVLYSPLHSKPEFYECTTKSGTTDLDFSLYTAHETLQISKSVPNTEVRYFDLNTSQVRNGPKIDSFNAAQEAFNLQRSSKPVESEKCMFVLSMDEITPRVMPSPQPSRIPVIDTMVPEVSLMFHDTDNKNHIPGPAPNISTQNSAQYGSNLQRNPVAFPYVVRQGQRHSNRATVHTVSGGLGAQRPTLTSAYNPRSNSPQPTACQRQPVYNPQTRQQTMRPDVNSLQYPGYGTSQPQQAQIQYHGSQAQLQGFQPQGQSPSVAFQPHSSYLQSQPNYVGFRQKCSPQQYQTQPVGFEQTMNQAATSSVRYPPGVSQSQGYTFQQPQYPPVQMCQSQSDRPVTTNLPHPISQPQSRFPVSYPQTVCGNRVMPVPPHPFTRHPHTVNPQHAQLQLVTVNGSVQNTHHMVPAPTQQRNGTSGQVPAPTHLRNGTSGQVPAPTQLRNVFPSSVPDSPAPRHDCCNNPVNGVPEQSNLTDSSSRSSQDSGLSVTPDRPVSKGNSAPTSPKSISSNTASVSLSQLTDSPKFHNVPAEVYQLLLHQDSQLKQMQAQIQELLKLQSPQTASQIPDRAVSKCSIALNTTLLDETTNSESTRVSQESTGVQTSPVKQSVLNRGISPVQDGSQTPPSKSEASTPAEVRHRGPPQLNSTAKFDSGDVILPGDLTAVMNNVRVEGTNESIQSDVIVDLPSFQSSPTRSGGSKDMSVSPISASMVEEQRETSDDVEGESKEYYNQLMENIHKLLHQQNNEDETLRNVDYSSMQSPTPSSRTRVDSTACNSTLISDELQSVLRFGPQATGLDTTFIPKINYVSMFLESDNDTSLEINSMAMKYLKDEQLTQLAKLRSTALLQGNGKKSALLQQVLQAGIGPTPNVTQCGMSPNDLTFATKKYMEKYGLLNSSNCEHSKSNDTPTAQRAKLTRPKSAQPSRSSTSKQTPSSNGCRGELYESYINVISTSGSNQDTGSPDKLLEYRMRESVVRRSPVTPSKRTVIQPVSPQVRQASSEQHTPQGEMKPSDSGQTHQLESDNILDVRRLKQLPKLL